MAIDYYSDTSEDTLDADEQQLYNLMMDYRQANGLPTIPLSRALTIVAGRHALDTVYNAQSYVGHNWSDAPYDSSNAATYPNMWEAPQRLNTGYSGYGFEISTGYLGAAVQTYKSTPQGALSNWQGSPGHNAVILNEGIWAQYTWNAIGIGMHRGVSHVWFGREPDPTGQPSFGDASTPAVTAPTIQVTSNGTTSTVPATAYSGTAPGIKWQYLGSGAAREDITGTSEADFINGLGGDDVIFGQNGNDILDGGVGSNFLRGDAGTDIFFTDARNGQVGWSTIVDFVPGVEQVTIWGFRPGITRVFWENNYGASGFEGATAFLDIDGSSQSDRSGVDFAVTFTGHSVGNLGPVYELDGLMWFRPTV